jgi:2-amino-4-hydroxy-6-hydroxymethyldihydropteridine diphosphokinase
VSGVERPVDADATQVDVELPEWAQVTEKRRAHIARVTALLDRWADALHLDPEERRAWHDVGLLHDALRDAPEQDLRRLAGDTERPVHILHGPAVAARLARDGEQRHDVLEAIRWHTLGSPTWSRTGKALYMADFLEPGRPFLRADRAFLAEHVVADFDGVFRQVVRVRIEWTVREGKMLFPETADLWNSVR